MKEAILNIKEITYSREIYNAKPRPFVSAFIYIFLAIVILALFYTYFAEIDIVSKGNGVVRPNENISTIKTAVQGELIEVDIEEGMMVNEGDIIYRLKNDDVQIQLDNLLILREDKLSKLDGLNQYMQSVLSNENLIDGLDYYSSKYEQYATNLSYMIHQNKSNELQLAQMSQHDKTGAIVSTMSQELYELRALKESIDLGALTTDNVNVLNNYNSYMNGLQSKQISYDQATIEFERSTSLYEEGYLSLKDYEDIESNHINAGIEYNQYKSNFLMNLESQIDNTYSSMQLKSIEHDSALLASDRLENEKEFNLVTIDKYQIDTIVGIQDEIIETEMQLLELEKNIDLAELELDKTIIRTPITGRVNILFDVAIGDLIVAGTDLATIIPEKETMHKMQIMLPNQEVANIQIGDEIKFNFHALPYKEYGYLRGTVLKIGSDIVNDNNAGGYYLVEAEIIDNAVTNAKGEIKHVKVGMTTEAHVITDQKSILNWLLEKINLLD